jgi:hypothetical protein
MSLVENRGARIYWDEQGQGGPAPHYGPRLGVQHVASHSPRPFRLLPHHSPR